jgi:hypothetical protein
MLIEKAFAKYKGGYSSAEGAMDEWTALELLTGNPATNARVTNGTEDELLTAMESALSAGEALVAGTSQSYYNEWTRTKAEQAEIDKLKIVMGHAYSVEGVDKAAKTVNLRNPWGSQHLRALPVAAFRKYFYKWSHVKVK